MKNEDLNQSTLNPETIESSKRKEEPFVNEECGDSMWSEVLNQPGILSINELANDFKLGFSL